MNEENDETNPAEDACFECGSTLFHYDCVEYHASCKGCGLVLPFDIGFEEIYVKPKTYFKENYFTNTILTNAMNKGFKINRHEMVEYERRYKLCVKSFYKTQDIHKRKYMMSASFVLLKIAESMNRDVSKFIKIPKKNTLRRLEKDWKIVNPF